MILPVGDFFSCLFVSFFDHRITSYAYVFSYQDFAISVLRWLCLVFEHCSATNINEPLRSETAFITLDSQYSIIVQL